MSNLTLVICIYVALILDRLTVDLFSAINIVRHSRHKPVDLPSMPMPIMGLPEHMKHYSYPNIKYVATLNKKFYVEEGRIVQLIGGKILFRDVDGIDHQFHQFDCELFDEIDAKVKMW